MANDITDIVTSYPWTSVPSNSEYRKEAPKVYAEAWKLTDSSIRTLAGNYVYNFLVAGGSSKDVFDYYDNIYAGAKKIERFVFPYFNDDVIGFTNEFGDAYSGGVGTGTQGTNSFMQTVGQTIEEVQNLVQGGRAIVNNDYGTYAEIPKFYQYGPTDDNVVIRFPLLNTIETGSSVPYEQNYKLIQKLKTLNKPIRLNGNVIMPPHLWELTIPGYRYIRWATCDVSVNLIGSRRILIGEGKIVPEGYIVSLIFKSLTIEPDNFKARYSATGGDFNNGGSEVASATESARAFISPGT